MLHYEESVVTRRKTYHGDAVHVLQLRCRVAPRQLACTNCGVVAREYVACCRECGRSQSVEISDIIRSIALTRSAMLEAYTPDNRHSRPKSFVLTEIMVSCQHGRIKSDYMVPGAAFSHVRQGHLAPQFAGACGACGGTAIWAGMRIDRDRLVPGTVFSLNNWATRKMSRCSRYLTY